MDNHRPPAADARAAEAFARGRSAEQQGALDEALAAYREALAGAPRQSEWWYRLGCVQRKQGDLVGAHEAFRQAVDLGGEGSRALTNLGTVLDELGRRAEAMQMYRGRSRPTRTTPTRTTTSARSMPRRAVPATPCAASKPPSAPGPTPRATSIWAWCISGTMLTTRPWPASSKA
ncbi:MAG: tetratricopeptide repeat protein [bacterium]|nr:tetratricopeptide repeat protein [bacterium]